MLSLGFEGWFECRLATDPDPSDEPRGVSGWTYAVGDEKDLDRVIRTQPEGTVGRLHGPAIGVTVREVSEHGKQAPDHVLIGAPVTLLNDPVFEGRNGLASEDTEEPVFPFHIRIAQDTVVLRREHREVATGLWNFEMSAGFANPVEISEATGINDPVAFRRQRRSQLERSMEKATSEAERVALKRRLDDIDRLDGGPRPITVGMLRAGLRYRYILEGPWFEVRDPERQLAGLVDGSPWIASIWMGCWDADALCGYMKGPLELPLLALRQPTA